MPKQEREAALTTRLFKLPTARDVNETPCGFGAMVVTGTRLLAGLPTLIYLAESPSARGRAYIYFIKKRNRDVGIKVPTTEMTNPRSAD